MTNVTFASFADFSSVVAAAGYTPMQYSDTIFYTKPNAKGAGKVEFNAKSNTFIVGSGSKYLEEITDAVAAAGFKLTKRVKGWSLFEATTMADFVRLVGLVEGAVPAPVKAPKAPKAKVTLNSLVSKALSGASKPKHQDALGEGLTAAMTKAIEKVAKPKTAEQIMRAAEIKAKNLATMKAVTAKINAEKAA